MESKAEGRRGKTCSAAETGTFTSGSESQKEGQADGNNEPVERRQAITIDHGGEAQSSEEGKAKTTTSAAKTTKTPRPLTGHKLVTVSPQIDPLVQHSPKNQQVMEAVRAGRTVPSKAYSSTQVKLDRVRRTGKLVESYEAARDEDGTWGWRLLRTMVPTESEHERE